MALNPAKQGEALNSPVERASKLNDPQFENQQGYFPYDLTHQEFITPLFGQITPIMHLDTVPGDRTVVHDNTKLILNQINGNFLSTLNQYVDSFYVPLRNVYPMNYEKLIPNPVKGDDLPNSALPQVPLYSLFYNFINDDDIEVEISGLDGSDVGAYTMLNLRNGLGDDPEEAGAYYLNRLVMLATVLSRGQLLDYLGIQFDGMTFNATISSELQRVIDNFFSKLWSAQVVDGREYIWAVQLESNTNNNFSWDNISRQYRMSNLSEFRSAIADSLERGEMLYYFMSEDLAIAAVEFCNLVSEIFAVGDSPDTIAQVDASDDPFGTKCLNIGKVLAYQQVVAHYYSNDHVDNIFSSELFMQNLRSVMFPTVSGYSSEPTFEMNGVNYEYDYISYGGFWSSLIRDTSGIHARQYLWMSIMLLLRRSLRYGDYFSTARPNMLAVSDQLSIAVSGGQVSPIDVTKNLLMQRYLNAANYIGQGYLQYMSSIYGIKPSDTGCIPRFISHRKIELQNQITNNTAENQGAQTTNIVGYSDMSAFDVFIDDFGYLISLTTFDVLPVYKSGIENTYHFADRFDYFNPMLQGIGDQPIRSSELLGFPNLRDDVFGYTMRNAEYKYKLSKAHGAFCNSLPGFMISYPVNAFDTYSEEYDLNINPDFIRDKPLYLDPVLPQMTGISPAEYFHFIVSCTNQVHCARKIQATPGVLF